MQGAFAACLIGVVSAAGAVAAEEEPPPLPPEPAASAFRFDGSPIGSYLAGRYAP